MTALKRMAWAIADRMPDRLALHLIYYGHYRRWPNLARPRLYSELLQAAKLGPRDPRLIVQGAKLSAKEFVREHLGEDWLIPTLWSGAVLPASPPWEPPFVVKANHGSGWIEVFRPGDTHWAALAEKAHGWVGQTYGRRFREWHYAEMPACLLVEPFVGEDGEFPTDYRLYVFDGRVEFLQVTARERGHDWFRGAFYDRDWGRLPFHSLHPLGEDDDFPPPASFDRMIAAAERLGAGHAFVRVDLYELDGRPTFSEMTFFPGSGYATPLEDDVRFGALWTREKAGATPSGGMV